MKIECMSCHYLSVTMYYKLDSLNFTKRASASIHNVKSQKYLERGENDIVSMRQSLSVVYLVEVERSYSNAMP